MGSGRETGALQRQSIWGIDDDGGYYAVPLSGSGSAVVVTGSLTATIQSGTVSFQAPTSFESSILTVTTTPVALAISITTKSVSIKAHFNNSQTVYLGPSNVSSTGWPLLAGDEISFDYNDTNTSIYLISSATSLVNYIALG